jgi:hypothetical protein
VSEVEESASQLGFGQAREGWRVGDEAGFSGFLDEFFDAEEGGQVSGNAVEGGGAFVACAGFLGFLDAVPLGPDGLGGAGLGGAEDVRVSADEFLVERAADVVEIESAAFLGQLGMEYDLEEEVAEFFGEQGVVAGFDGIEQFVDFFDGVVA